MEILSLGTPAVVVPFAAGSETEQSLRARLLAKRGLLTVVCGSGTSRPQGLAAAIDRTVGRDDSETAALPNLDLDGAAKTATILRQILEMGPP